MTVSEITRLLTNEYGTREWHAHHDPLSELVAVILSQNTSDSNSGRAFASLTAAFPKWEDAESAGMEEIERAIRSGGLSQVKAARIKAILQTIRAERGSLDLSFLGTMRIDEAKSWLRRLPGVGPKTVGCVLLFALGKPVMPVDTHVYRVSKRLGIIGSGVSVERAHELLEKMVPPPDIYAFHMNMVAHGRKVCKSQRPRCPDCVLRRLCLSTALFTTKYTKNTEKKSLKPS
ncbi:MAG: endonuclease III [Chloroflexi bacterium]|nr:endonuclease III [Chloroflexota bacterium]